MTPIPVSARLFLAPLNPMKTKHRRTSSVAALAVAALALALAPSRALAQANPNPPELLTYQGFLVDGNGVALGNAAPRNYDVIFKIYNHETASAGVNLLWGEQQTVTVDKGYFSVLLGEGAAVAGVPRDGIPLSSLFKGPVASDRFVGITVKGIGSGGADVDILPRLRLLSSPYAFLAQQAVKLVRTDNGSDLISSLGGGVTVSGGLAVAGNNILELGAGVAGKESSAGKIGYGVFTADTLDIVGAGTLGSNRKVKIWAEGGTIFAGAVQATSFSGDGGGLTGVAKLTGGNTFGGNQIFNDPVGIGTASPGFPLNFPNTLGDKISLWGNTGNHYGFGIQAGTLQIHTAGATDTIRFGYGSSASMIETMRLEGNGRAVLQGGFLAKGGYPGGGGGNNAGYAFSGSGGDNDSGMYSDADGHVRFTSNSSLRMSVYPSGVYVHDGGLNVDGSVSLNGGHQEFYRWGMRLKRENDTSRYVDWARYQNYFSFWMYGGNTHNSGTREVRYDGDGNWDFYSDRKLKKDIVDAEPMLDRALQVQIRRYRWKDEEETAKHKLGVIAQEVQPLFPDLVSQGEDRETQEPILSVGYSDFGMVAIKALQELKVQHDAELAELRTQMADLKAQMATLLRVNGQLLERVEKAAATTAAVR
jgi:hypothetical protein